MLPCLGPGDGKGDQKTGEERTRHLKYKQFETLKKQMQDLGSYLLD